MYSTLSPLISGHSPKRGVSAMDKQGSDQRMTRKTNAIMGEFAFDNAVDANKSETAEYLAQMASELFTLAKTARLERLSLLLDFVRREAEAETGAA